MKIGIFTQPLLLNYGGLLQAYALQTTLLRMGHEVVIINRRYSKKMLLRLFLGRCFRKVFCKGKLPLFRGYLTPNKVAAIGELTDAFIARNIHVTERFYSNHELHTFLSTNAFDAFIVGSDQVWRPLFSPHLYTYFLDFAEEKTLKLSYAASFGMDEWEFTPKQTRRCSKLLQRFDSVSVREDSAINLCSKYLHREDARLVLDPTLLLSKEDYKAIVEKQSTPMSRGNLMTYVLDATAEKQKIVEMIAQEKHLKSFSVIANGNYELGNASIDDCIQPAVEEWLRGFMDAEYVVADSYHGCVFAIIFNIPFIAIGNHERGMTRFLSLFNLFGLEDRLVYTISDVTAEKINASIDWKRVNARREELIAVSMQFLTTALKQK